ncbi:hypothetical protein P7H16_20120 [Paenibacillus larvae]|nr:hypothetical protein [Paenibacillus larvae]MDT2248754.1 hypothetical protein [Paenibacillus larvae]
MDAHAYAEKVEVITTKEFNRDSLDDEGMQIKSTVHLGLNYNNAFGMGNKLLMEMVMELTFGAFSSDLGVNWS